MREEQTEKIKELLRTRAISEFYHDKFILFHGTTDLFDEIDLNKSTPHTDFGAGFYLTNIYEQAAEWAGKKRSRILSSFRNYTKTVVYDEGELPKAYVMKYQFHIEDIKALDMRKKVFEKYDEEWLELVAHYRYLDDDKKLFNEEYDITIGPMADGDLKLLIYNYKKKKIKAEQALSEIQFRKPTMQITFHTKKALELLQPFGKATTIL